MDSPRMYIISVYSENQVGLMSSISNIFTRRNINIESITAFPSEFPGIHLVTFRAITTDSSAQQVVKFLEKKVDVIRAFAYPSHEVSDSMHEVVAAYLKERKNI